MVVWLLSDNEDRYGECFTLGTCMGRHTIDLYYKQADHYIFYSNPLAFKPMEAMTSLIL